MNLTGLTNVGRQGAQGVTRPAPDLQHPLTGGDPERAEAGVTGDVLARIGDEIVRWLIES